MNKKWISWIAVLLAISLHCQAPDPVRVNRLSERVLLLTEDSPMENIVVAVATKKGIVVIDSTGSPHTAKLFRKAIEKEFGRSDFRYLINTHPHWDHAWGNQSFPEAVVVGHEAGITPLSRDGNTARNMVERTKPRIQALEKTGSLQTGSPDEQRLLANDLAFRRRIVLGLENDFTPVPAMVSFSDRMNLDMGDITFRLVFFGRAHSGSDIFIHIPEEKLLLTGDIFLDIGWLPLFAGMETLDIPRWIEVLDTLFAVPDGFTTVIPGHRKVWSREKLKVWKEYIETLWLGVQAAKQDKVPFAEVLKRFPLPQSCSYLRELGHDEKSLRTFQEGNITAFWRQLLLPVTPILERTIREKGIQAAVAQGREIWRSGQNEYFLDERTLNGFGYQLLNHGETEAAVAIMKLMTELFSQSANAFDSLGEAYMTAGNTKLAIENYEKSLQLNPANTNAKEMLKELRGKK